MRKETIRYLNAEYRNYQRSVKELQELTDRVALIKRYPVYKGDYRKQLTYFTNRIESLTKATKAIKEIYESLPDEDQKLIRLKFWQSTTDLQAITELHISRAAFYQHIRKVCRLLGKELGTDL